MKTILMTLTMLITMGCGSLPEVEKNDAKASPDPTPDAETDEQPTADNTDVSVGVAVDVAVSVCSSEADHRSIDMVYKPEARYSDEAQALAPSGYRLPTRSELLALYDSGELARRVDRSAILWTETSADDMGFYCFDVSSGQFFIGQRSFAASALYGRF